MPVPIPDLTATQWDRVHEIVSKRLNNLPDVAGAYRWVSQSLKRDMSFPTFKKLLRAERIRNPRWSANSNVAVASDASAGPSPAAVKRPLPVGFADSYGPAKASKAEGADATEDSADSVSPGANADENVERARGLYGTHTRST